MMIPRANGVNGGRKKPRNKRRAFIRNDRGPFLGVIHWLGLYAGRSLSAPMNSDLKPKEHEAKRREDSFLSSALVFGAVLIPSVLNGTVGLPRSWGNVIGFAVAATLAYFLLPSPRKNPSRFALISLSKH
jgi:hypothetical protein